MRAKKSLTSLGGDVGMHRYLRSKLVVVGLVALMSVAVSAFAQSQYSFGYDTCPGEVLVYTGEVSTQVEVPWVELSDHSPKMMYYRTTLTTQAAEDEVISRLEETVVTLPNGERISDQVTYRLLAPDFAYIDTPGGAVTGVDFFPPIPVAAGMSWTITTELAIPYVNAILPVTTTYQLQEIVPIGTDKVAVIRHYTELERGTVDYLQTEMNLDLKAWGKSFWSLGSGDYVGRSVTNQIILELPAEMGGGEMVTTVKRSEVIESGNAVPAPIEDYIMLYLQKQLD